MATASEKPEFVCFYMQNDQFCKNFISKLQSKSELMTKFNMVDIDSIPVIPNEVEEVPAVYDGKQLYQGKDAFKWLNEKMSEFLSAANDGMLYSFVDGQDEKVFNSYSFLDQRNGSHGIGEAPPGGDPGRSSAVNENSFKNRTLETLMATRSQDITSFSSDPQRKSLNVV